MVTAGASVRTSGKTNFVGNLAKADGGTDNVCGCASLMFRCLRLRMHTVRGCLVENCIAAHEVP